MKAIACLALVIAVPATAQIRPIPGAGDPRLQTAIYDPNQILQLPVAAGYQLTLVLNSDEAIETIAIGDGGGWQVTASKRGDSLFIRSDTSARPTNLSVITNVRSYAFELIAMAARTPDAPYRVQFIYPGSMPTLPNAPAPQGTGVYRLGGAKSVRPDAMSDDGTRTFIEWRADQTLPAVFAIDETGQEVLVDGFMRDGRYVIDSVRDKFVFRLDRQTARATRMKPKSQ